MCLALLYSPWGSPDLYYNQNVYYALNQGVDFSRSGGIRNAPDWKSTANSEVDFEAETYEKSRTVSHNTSYNSSPVYARRVASRSGNTSRYNAGSSGSTSTGGGGGSFTGGGSTKSVVSTTRIQNAFSGMLPAGLGMGQAVVDLSLFGDSTATKNMAMQQKSIVDPGYENPIGEPIPVPEGWGFLIVMGVIYAGYRYKTQLKPRN
jgi:hypothetical protein